MRIPKKTPLIPALATSFLVAGTASGQESTTRGLTLGFHAQGSSLTVEDGERNTGGGAGVRAGYGINRRVTLYFQADGGQVEVEGSEDLTGTWTMAHVDLGVRFHFANSLRRVVPYLEAALGARAVNVADAVVSGEDAGDVSFSGAAFSVGGGVSFYLKRNLALDIELIATSGEFTQIDVGNISVSGLDIDASSTRFNVGVAWWP